MSPASTRPSGRRRFFPKLAGLGIRDGLETCHGEAAERQHVIAIALLDL
jgi:hypothetical protein